MTCITFLSGASQPDHYSCVQTWLRVINGGQPPDELAAANVRMVNGTNRPTTIPNICQLHYICHCCLPIQARTIPRAAPQERTGGPHGLSRPPCHDDQTMIGFGARPLALSGLCRIVYAFGMKIGSAPVVAVSSGRTSLAPSEAS